MYTKYIFYSLAIMDLSEKDIFKFILANNLRSTEELITKYSEEITVDAISVKVLKDVYKKFSRSLSKVKKSMGKKKLDNEAILKAASDDIILHAEICAKVSLLIVIKV